MSNPDDHLVALALECLRLARPAPMAPENAGDDDPDGNLMRPDDSNPEGEK